MSNKTENREQQFMSDQDIIDLYWERNERAIQETDRKYGKYLFTIAYNIVHNRLDSEECLNDTYLGTWNRIPPDKPTVFQAFLSRIMRNIAIDRFRSNHAQKNIPSELQVSLDELDECVPAESDEEQAMVEITRALNGFIETMAPRHEFIFICRYYYADSVANISRMLGVSDKTVYRELGEIRNALREHLVKEGLYLE